jgi:hypothetical protein
MPNLGLTFSCLISGFITFGLDLFCCKISVHEPLCRHALEAFAHKIGKTNCQYDSFLTRMANHNSSTSTYYGRDQHAIIGIPADITEANFERCGTVCMMWQCKITLR